MVYSDPESRLTALEKQNRLTRGLLGAVLAMVGVLALVGMGGQEKPTDARFRIVYASKFAVQDPRTGKTRATLAHQTMAGGWAGLTLWDNDGNPRAELKLWEDGSMRLSMLAEDRKYNAKLSVSADGDPSMELAGKTLGQE